MAKAKPDYEGRASVFKNGRSQAVRLPKECRFGDVSEVAIRKEGNEVILRPIHKTWRDYFSRATRPTDDFVEAILSMEDLPIEERESLD
jgi:antitoxin VapB